MRRDNGLDVVPADGEGTDWETVGIAADDGVCVLLCNVAFGVFWTYDEIVCLVNLDSVCDCGEIKLETYSTIGLDKEPVDCQTSRKDLYICVYLGKRFDMADV